MSKISQIDPCRLKVWEGRHSFRLLTQYKEGLAVPFSVFIVFGILRTFSQPSARSRLSSSMAGLVSRRLTWTSRVTAPRPPSAVIPLLFTVRFALFSRSTHILAFVFFCWFHTLSFACSPLIHSHALTLRASFATSTVRRRFSSWRTCSIFPRLSATLNYPAVFRAGKSRWRHLSSSLAKNVWLDSFFRHSLFARRVIERSFVLLGVCFVLSCREADYTKGIFQSIGFKEFHEYLVTPSNEQDTERGHKLLKEGVEALKVTTRRYARRQVKWIVKRFLQQPDRQVITYLTKRFRIWLSPPSTQVPPVYGLDATDVSEWDERVRDPTFRVVEAFVTAEADVGGGECTAPPGLEPLPVASASSRDEQTSFHCPICDVVTVGRRQWQQHLQGNRHRKMAKRAARNTTEASESSWTTPPSALALW